MTSRSSKEHWGRDLEGKCPHCTMVELLGTLYGSLHHHEQRDWVREIVSNMTEDFGTVSSYMAASDVCRWAEQMEELSR